MDSYVYCALDIDTNLVKIGFSTNPKDRIRHLNTSTGNTIKLICAIEGDRILEKSLHKKFSKYRVKGEWFRFTEQIKDHMLNLKPAKIPSACVVDKKTISILLNRELLERFEASVFPVKSALLIEAMIEAFMNREIEINIAPGKTIVKQKEKD